jgi:TrmH family RNA methyltransferase
LRDVVLALWRLSDPGNVGTLLRTADAFGAGVALSDGCADPTGPRATRASAGAIFRVPLMSWNDVPERHVALVAHGGVPIGDVSLEKPLAFLLGSEREGLPENLVTDRHKITIPVPGDAESLNVAAAGAIALYELSRRG